MSASRALSGSGPHLGYDEAVALYENGKEGAGRKRSTVCPVCSPSKPAPARNRPTMALWLLENGAISYNCLRCGLKGATPANVLGIARALSPAADAALALDSPRATGHLAAYLWHQSLPATGTLAEAYLKSRALMCEIPPTIRFLPATEARPHPRLIAGCGLEIDEDSRVMPGTPSALLRVYLAPDGSGKARINCPKPSLGNVKGQACWLRPAKDRLSVAVAEGIEDAMSLGWAFGIGAIAVGGAWNLPHVAANLPSYLESILIAEDVDEAGRKGCAEAVRILSERTDWRSGRPPHTRRIPFPRSAKE